MDWRGVICPVCHEALAAAASLLHCPAGHSFDIAREGYVNLLRWPGRPPAIIGDRGEMVHARRRFLANGWYQPLADLIKAQMGQGRGVILDAGCGEGTYTGQMAGNRPHRRVFGIDISKTAVRLAARRYPNIRFLAADIHRFIPMASRSVDVLVNIFAPRNPTAFTRVVKQDGRLLIVIPNPDHLKELRARFGLLNIEANKPRKIITQMEEGFSLANKSPLSFSMDLDQAALKDLLQMTPNYWHWTEKQQKGLEVITRTAVWASFTLLEFIRR